MAKSDHNGHGHKTKTPDVSHIRNVEVTHEMSDVDVKGILTFVVGLTVMTVVVYLLMLLMFNVMNKQEETKDKERPRSPMVLSEKERLPPEPRLQAAPGFGVNLSNGQKVDLSLRPPQEEYQVVHKQWEQVLNEGARDQSGKIVGVPIDQAMNKVLEGNGLPSRSQAPGDSDYSVQTPTSASSGRMTEKGKQ
jgi:hypothetical protein